jgi:tRNA A-37 threonylcarbamoyl transferase component Bud32
VNAQGRADPSEPGSLIASGRTADVFDLGDDRVLRRYRDGGDAGAEAELMRHVALHGYPAPAVYAATGPDLVMELIEGPTMVEAIAADDLDMGEAASMLGHLHDWLHRLPGRTEGSHVLHLDLHPLNVMLPARGPVVIDWGAAREGDPALDVAMTALIIAEVAASPTEDLAPLAGELLRGFVTAVRVDAGFLLDDAVGLRRQDPHLTTEEHERLGDAAALVRAARGSSPR